MRIAAAADDTELSSDRSKMLPGDCSEAETDQSEESRGQPRPIRDHYYSASIILAVGGEKGEVERMLMSRDFRNVEKIHHQRI